MNERGNTSADKDYKQSEIVNDLAEGQVKAVQLTNGTYITEKLAKSMTKAQAAALEAFPEQMTPLVYQDVIDAFGGKTEVDFNLLPRNYFQLGYEKAEKDILSTIESRLSEIIGDAQPRPALRAELEELIKRIKDGKY